MAAAVAIYTPVYGFVVVLIAVPSGDADLLVASTVHPATRHTVRAGTLHALQVSHASSPGLQATLKVPRTCS